MSSHSNRKRAETKKAKNLSPTEEEIEQLIATLSEVQNPKTRMRAAEALGKIGEPAIKPLSSALTEERWEVRSNAILALEKIGQPATHVFQEAMTDHDWFVRATAVKALGQIKDARAVKGLISVLNDKDWFVRERAAEVLGKIGDATSIKPLMETFHDEELYVRAKAVLAFERVRRRIAASAER